MGTAPTPTKPAEELGEDTGISSGSPAKVILFNDDVHTFEEVASQLIKALGCGTSKAEALTWEVHTRGKASVFEGAMDECVRVSAVLEEISLHTQIEV